HVRSVDDLRESSVRLAGTKELAAGDEAVAVHEYRKPGHLQDGHCPIFSVQLVPLWEKGPDSRCSKWNRLERTPHRQRDNGKVAFPYRQHLPKPHRPGLNHFDPHFGMGGNPFGEERSEIGPSCSRCRTEPQNMLSLVIQVAAETRHLSPDLAGVTQHDRSRLGELRSPGTPFQHTDPKLALEARNGSRD